MEAYDHKKIELRWQKHWKENRVYSPDFAKAKKPFYNLMMFPYPSAEGLHVGNMYAFVHADTYGRFMRLKGFDVFEPIGLDGFGIHSENYAIKVGEHISDVSKRTEKHFYEQLRIVGNQYDWEKTLETYKPQYYKWTQWIFVQMFKKGLAYQTESYVNWCPSCKTVLSDEQVISERCERCDSIVEKKMMKQWFFRITEYAERLLKNLDWIDWSERTKIAQKNWIGKSEGAQFEMEIKDSDLKLEVFTTRLDTVFGMTFALIAPEHELVKKLKPQIENWDEVQKYIDETSKKSELQRITEAKEKTGVQLKGIRIANPFTKEEISLFASDFVLAHYGTGAVMAVPAHDERDFEFAKKYNIPIRPTIVPNLGNANEGGEIKKMKKIIQEVDAVLSKENIKVWFNGTFGVIGYYKKTFDVPKDVDCGVLEKDFDNAKNIIEKLGYSKLEDKENEKFKVSMYQKDGITFEIGTFDRDLGDTWGEIGGLKFRIPNSEWLAQCYRITAEKERRKTKNDLERAIFLELISNTAKNAFVEDGVLINSGKYNGLTSEQAREKLTKEAEKNKIGFGKINYKLRDWCVSRQRYWGPPIPMIYCEKDGWQPVPEKDLPVLLPETKDYLPQPDGLSPLARNEKFYKTVCPKCVGPARRETDVSDTFLDSAWYFFRYPSVEFDDKIFDKDRTKKWLPVDMYIGGHEHAVLHLLYSRFVTMFFKDLELIDFEEPYKRFFAHGLLIREGAKMSKSKGNVINPDEYIDKYGADSVRMYLMFLGDVRQGGDWRDSGMNGMFRFINRVWRSFEEKDKGGAGLKDVSFIDKTIKKVDDNLADLKFNSAIARIMEYVNWYEDNDAEFSIPQKKKIFEILSLLLAPFAPHIAEELWNQLGHKDSIFKEKWPEYDPALVKDDIISLVIQVNGKVRDTVEAEVDITEAKAKELALNRDNVKRWLEGKEIKKVIFVPNKLINIVV